MLEGCGCSPDAPNQIALTFGGNTVRWVLAEDEAAMLLEAMKQALGKAREERS